jgi:toxin ParE1/3/4
MPLRIYLIFGIIPSIPGLKVKRTNIINLILNACAAIAKKPQQGKVYEEIYPELKGKKASKHIIFYRIMEDKSIEITRILHERMDLKNKLK